MKKVLLVVAIAFLGKISHSQVFVEDVNINELDVTYIQLAGFNASMFGQKFVVEVDYGQKLGFVKANDIKDADGKKIKFHSMIQALNFMKKNGWEFVNYRESRVSGKTRFLYLLKKKD